MAERDHPGGRDSLPDDVELPLIPKAPRLPSAEPRGLPGTGASARPPDGGTKTKSLRPRPLPRASAAPIARRRTNISRIIAMILCVLFALVGAVPVLAGVLVRTSWVRAWAAAETSRLLEKQLGARATYDIHVEPWPLSLSLEHVIVEGDDGKGPFLEVERAAVRPRLFSLLGGKLDAGDVEVTGARVRVVVKDGELVSFRPKLEEKPDDEPGSGRAPFESLSITDAQLDLDIEGVLARVREVDLDLAQEEGGAFEVALRSGGALVTRKHETPHDPSFDAVDEDRLCKLETRLRYETESEVLLVRRLDLQIAADFDPALGTRPSCDLVPGDWRRVAVSVGALRVPVGSLLKGETNPAVEGRVGLTVPAALLHRFVDFPHASGMVEIELDVEPQPGSRFPGAQGRIKAEMLGIDGKVFSDVFEGRLLWKNDELVVNDVRAVWGDGTFLMREVTLSPFTPGIPLEAKEIVADGVTIQGLLRDLGAHPQAHVGWDIAHVEIPRFGGSLDPIGLSGDLVANTKSFGVYDRPPHRENKRRMVSVDRGDVTGKLVIGKSAVLLQGMHLVTPKSEVFTTVKLGYADDFGLDVGKGSHVDMAELSPLVQVDVGGVVDVEARGTGTFDQPRIEGTIAAKAFTIGGFDAGDVRRAEVVFMPLWLEFTNVELEKNASLITAPRLKIAFDAGADVLVDAQVEAREAPYLAVRDFLEVFHFDEDPRFDGLEGTAIGSATVHYALGGPEDKCGGGALDVRARTKLDRPRLFGETFDSGDLDLRFIYDDTRAGDAGMEVDIASASFRDDKGSLVGQVRIHRGGALRGSLVASGISLDRIEGLGAAAAYLDAEAHALATLGGTLARPEARVDVSLGPLRMGARRLPPSRFFVDLEPDPTPNERIGTTQCGHPITRSREPTGGDKDPPSGQLRLNGQLAGGQIRLEDITVSRQRSAVVKGRLSLSGLDVGTVLGGIPGLAFSNQLPEGSLSAQIDIGRLQIDDLGATQAQMDLFDLEVRRGGRTVELDEASAPITLENARLVVPRLEMELADKSGLKIGFAAEGRIDSLVASPDIDARLTIAPFDLGKLRDDFEGLDRLEGELSGELAVKGPLSRPSLTGGAKLRRGGLALASPDIAIDDVEVDVAVGDGEIRVTRATAKVGAGTVDVTGHVPIAGLGLGAGSATITVRGVRVPVEDGIEVVADADLEGTLKPPARGEVGMPELRGTVRLLSFSYTRPIGLSIDLNAVSRNLGRAEVDAVDPDGDYLKFDINVVSQRPLAVRNDLADLRLEVVEPGIQIAGTNQRYGARGALRLLSESKLRLRSHEFDVREGFVRFEDPSKVKALVDVRATTEIRRYAAAQDPGADATAATGSATGGQWDVNVHAHGSTDDLKLDLTSDPALNQDDIVLLLTVGMTRAELDRSLLSSLGETVGLEALGALTGADKAVKSVVPIDYFHFGSGYSSRTGKTEPNVTIGKRLSDDVRASVTTTLTERDVGANVEWRLQKGLSLQANYDNTNDIGSIIGNLGADLRWRLEFE